MCNQILKVRFKASVQLPSVGVIIKKPERAKDIPYFIGKVMSCNDSRQDMVICTYYEKPPGYCDSIATACAEGEYL